MNLVLDHSDLVRDDACWLLPGLGLDGSAGISGYGVAFLIALYVPSVLNVHFGLTKLKIVSLKIWRIILGMVAGCGTTRAVSGILLWFRLESFDRRARFCLIWCMFLIFGLGSSERHCGQNLTL